MNIGRNIKTARTIKKMNQSELAQSINISNSSISQYESGEKIPSLSVITAISNVTGKPLYWFFMSEEEQTEWSEKQAFSSEKAKYFAGLSPEEQTLALEALELYKKYTE